LLERLNPVLTHTEARRFGRACGSRSRASGRREDHPREGLTVADEREHVLFYLIEILYRVVPLFYEEVESALAQAYAVPVESLDVPSILHFGSWWAATWTATPTCTARPSARRCTGISS